MRTIAVLIRKEFTQIRRNRIILPAMIVAPLVQLFILVYAANMNMRDIDFCFLDEDGTSMSGNLMAKYSASPFFSFSGAVFNLEEAEDRIREDKADLIIHVPDGFEKSVTENRPVKVQFLVNGINSAAGVLVASYSQNILLDFNRNILSGFAGMAGNRGKGTIEVSYNHWYNPDLEFKIFMVPGILVILVTLVGWLLMSLNVVRERIGND